MNPLTLDAQAIWSAGVAAVDSHRLVAEQVRFEDGQLSIAGRAFALENRGRLLVVGAGKAGAGMAAGVEYALQGADDRWKLRGWVNLPADCLRPLRSIHLHAARPAGVNEPTPAGVAGAEAILREVAALGEADVCLCLLSGGGSALLPAPATGVSLADKQALTRWLSGAGANIQQLNTVRKQLSRVKGGGLAAACRAGALITLIISDVIGDPLDVIASGPTVPDSATPADALQVLRDFDAEAVAPEATAYLRRRAEEAEPPAFRAPPINLQRVIGNNETAVLAAAAEARRRGYATIAEPAIGLEGDAERLGRQLAERAMSLPAGRRCLITGGEPTVALAPPDIRGRGGRNQQLVLAALDAWRGAGESRDARWTLLSGGTDGEDGPTDAAGAWLDDAVLRRAAELGFDAADYLRRNDAYTFFERTGGLLRTGPTHTNVCDVRVVVGE